jgi:DNA-binding beta-propeller fold protein YncE
MKRLATLLLAAAAFAIPASAPAIGQEIGFSASEPLQLPHDTFFGAVAGVATNSKGHVFVYSRTGTPVATLGGARPFMRAGSVLNEFDETGKYVRSVGKNLYGALAAAAVRVDRNDNVWIVDTYSGMVIKFDPQLRILMMLGRKPESVDVPALPNTGRAAQGAPAASGMPQDLFEMPTDVAFDNDGNIFVADGTGNARIAKFDRNGVFVKSWGSRGAGNEQFAAARSVAVDASGNVYVADRGNNRIQVFDNNGAYKSSITTAGNPQALCISPGAHQYLYASNSNPVNDIDAGGEIYKLELSGTVVGKFGRAGRQLKEFNAVNAIDCRSANTLLVGEMGNWRVQKLNLTN